MPLKGRQIVSLHYRTQPDVAMKRANKINLQASDLAAVDLGVNVT